MTATTTTHTTTPAPSCDHADRVLVTRNDRTCAVFSDEDGWHWSFGPEEGQSSWDMGGPQPTREDAIEEAFFLMQ